MKYTKILAILLCICMVLPLEGIAAASKTPASEGKFISIGDGANDFAFRLTAELLEANGKSNFVCSPYSVWLPLAALASATDNANRPALLKAIGAAGYTTKQLDEAAKQSLSGITSGRINDSYNPLQIANAIFVGKKFTLKNKFQQNFSKTYSGKVFRVDFSSPKAVKTVNDWASKNTKGLIPSIIKEFSPNTVAAIANAIYFSDRWTIAFNPDQTTKNTFYGRTGNTKANFMLLEGNALPYYEDNTLQAIELHFKTGGSMYILLPKKGDAVSLLSGMKYANFQKILDNITKKTGKLLLPRIKIDNNGSDLKKPLQKLGVPLFDSKTAPLTGGLLNENIPLYLGAAIQKATIKLDEKGTTAAAVTVVSVITKSIAPPPTTPFAMVCNKPFAFVLSGANGQILFTGVVNQAT